MTIQAIDNCNVKKYVNTKNTGYLALGMMGATVLSLKNPYRYKHKLFGGLTVATSLLHLLTTFNHSKTDNKKINKLA